MKFNTKMTNNMQPFHVCAACTLFVASGDNSASFLLYCLLFTVVGHEFFKQSWNKYSQVDMTETLGENFAFSASGDSSSTTFPVRKEDEEAIDAIRTPFVMTTGVFRNGLLLVAVLLLSMCAKSIADNYCWGLVAFFGAVGSFPVASFRFLAAHKLFCNNQKIATAAFTMAFCYVLLYPLSAAGHFLLAVSLWSCGFILNHYLMMLAELHSMALWMTLFLVALATSPVVLVHLYETVLNGTGKAKMSFVWYMSAAAFVLWEMKPVFVFFKVNALGMTKLARQGLQDFAYIFAQCFCHLLCIVPLDVWAFILLGGILCGTQDFAFWEDLTDWEYDDMCGVLIVVGALHLNARLVIATEFSEKYNTLHDMLVDVAGLNSFVAFGVSYLLMLFTGTVLALLVFLVAASTVVISLVALAIFLLALALCRTVQFLIQQYHNYDFQSQHVYWYTPPHPEQQQSSSQGYATTGLYCDPMSFYLNVQKEPRAQFYPYVHQSSVSNYIYRRQN